MMTGAFQVPVIRHRLRRCALLALTQLSFHFVQAFHEFEQELNQMPNGLFGGEAVLAPEGIELLGSIGGHTGISFRDEGWDETKQQKTAASK